MALSMEHNVPFMELNDHVEDLVYRFANKQLGDTVKRVGNDLNRKLNPNDRLVGALNLCKKQGIEPKYICLAIAAALCFPFDENVSGTAPEQMLTEIAKLDPASKEYAAILKYYDLLKARKTTKELVAILKAD